MNTCSSVKRDNEEEMIYLSLLNNHFKSVTCSEKYINASVNLIFSHINEKVLGKNFKKKRISKHKEKKIKSLIIQKLHNKYGKYVNLYNFRIKSVNQTFFKTNLDSIFTVPGYGKLYGCYYHKTCGNIFLTLHSLERFEERADKTYLIPLKELLKKMQETDSTTVDIISALIITSNFEYGRSKEFLHLNIGIGVLIIEDLGDVYIAKTFLSSNMFKDQLKWFRPNIPENRDQIKSFAEILKCDCNQIDQPEFESDPKEIQCL